MGVVGGNFPLRTLRGCETSKTFENSPKLRHFKANFPLRTLRGCEASKTDMKLLKPAEYNYKKV